MQHIKITAGTYTGEAGVGQYLDLYEDFSVEYTKTNIIYAFESAACERSTSFDIPRTAKNDKILGLPGRISGDNTVNKGDAATARHRVKADLEDGAVVKSGWLYINAVKEDSYECVFLIGELIGLLAVSESGNIADYIGNMDLGAKKYTTTASFFTNANVSGSTLGAFELIKYREDGEGINKPSVKVLYLINTAATALGVSVDTSNISNIDDLRIIIRKPSNCRKEGCYLIHTGTPQTGSNTADLAQACPYGSLFSSATFAMRTMFGGTVNQYNLLGFHASADLTLTFDSSTLSKFSLRTHPNTTTGRDAYEGELFTDADGETGANLAGKTIKIAEGDEFFLANADNFSYTNTDKGYLKSVAAYLAATIEGDGDPVDGNWVRLSDNLPEVTLLDLCRMVAAVSGLLMTWDEDTKTISFTDGNPTGTGHYDIYINNVTEIGDIERAFGDWAQQNVIAFDSADEVQSWEKITRTYEITNDNLTAESELLILPVSEGKTTAKNEVRLETSEDPTLCLTGSALPTTNMGRVALAANAHLTALCTGSTALELTYKGTALDFEQLTPNARLIWRNLAWVWTEATYSDGLIRVKISKIAI